MNPEVPIISKFKITEFIFFGNYFYGICAVALSIEAMLQQQVTLNGSLYFFIVFTSTVLYYGYPYIRKCTVISSNPRTNWFSNNYKLMTTNQVIMTSILIIALVLFLINYSANVFRLDVGEWLIVLFFPLVAGLYYGINVFNIRKIGWLKPFIIGLTWAGLVTVYPVLFHDIVNGTHYELTVIGVLLFLKNLMFVSVLCIMFDIKDYSTDYTNHLKTLVVTTGLRFTIFYVLIPLAIIGLITFIYFAMTHGFHTGKLLLNTIPFLFMIVAAISLKRRRSILYYLIVIDGLMLLKAICGIFAMIYF